MKDENIFVKGKLDFLSSRPSKLIPPLRVIDELLKTDREYQKLERCRHIASVLAHLSIIYIVIGLFYGCLYSIISHILSQNVAKIFVGYDVKMVELSFLEATIYYFTSKPIYTIIFLALLVMGIIFDFQARKRQLQKIEELCLLED